MHRHFFATLVVLAAAVHAAAAQTATSATSATPQQQEQQAKTLNLSAYAELLRSDVRAQKIAILTEVMGFTEAEDAAFWPIYREYDAEMAKLGDERVALIAEYAKHYDEMTEAVADSLATKALDLQQRRQAVEAKYYERVKAALKPRQALRYLQVEHQLLLLIDLQVSAGLPIAK
jgi:hypothetical protein